MQPPQTLTESLSDPRSESRLYAAVIFLGAFLLFQVQPMMAKLLLPWFGGSAAVWTACMLFYQTGLLAGYAYARVAAAWQGRMSSRVHLGLLLVSLACLPLAPQPTADVATAAPVWQILKLLTLSLGLPYLALAATGPLLQAWFARARQQAPYQLYSLSNAASLLALLSYPLLVEPWLPTHLQTRIWSGAFALFGLLCAAVAWRARPLTQAAAGAESAGGPGWRLAAYWLLLSACACTLLLAITNQLTQQLAPVPLLWVVPLALYLCSFVICFAGPAWNRVWLFRGLAAAALVSLGWAASLDLFSPSLGLSLPLYCGGLFACCLFCNGELARTKPAARHLGSFYLAQALGGAAGGLFVALLAPALFHNFYELPLALLGCAALLAATLRPGAQSDTSPTVAGPLWSASVALALLLAMTLGLAAWHQQQAARVAVRNFYGVLRVRENQRQAGAVRTLLHGAITHGDQFLDPARSLQPTTYFGPDGGVGRAMRTLLGQAREPQRVGVVGLGIGILAAYGRPGDVFRFYEINPLVVELARSQFTFLSGGPARIELVPGDARLSLEREPPQAYDMLVLDAFSGDSIPVHLLTQEAFADYFRQLKPHGVLAVHVSNRYLDLAPIAAAAAYSFGRQAIIVRSGGNHTLDTFASDWVLICDRPEFFQEPLVAAASSPILPIAGLRAWTDDDSNLLRILRWRLPARRSD